MSTPSTPGRSPLSAEGLEPHYLDSLANVESFAVSTVPLVPTSRARRGDAASGEKPDASGDGDDGDGEARHFALRDLWESYDEWSAYGAEVPLTLDDEEDEGSQYYVPFLSGLQIFRATGEDDEGTSGEEGRKEKSERGKTKDAADDDGDGDPPRSSMSKTGDVVPGRELVFSFFERDSPYSRAPLSDVVARLARDAPELWTTRSEETHPASWMSIAWYPIYRIPVGRSLRDLSACFLTYHALSTAHGGVQGAEKKKTDEEKAAGEEEEDPRSEAWIDAVGCPTPPPISAHGERVMRTRAEKAASGPAAEGEGEGTSTARASPTPLRAFGLSYYKLRGEMWHAKEVADWLAMMTDGAFSWLKRLKVIHPDFEFFSHHG